MALRKKIITVSTQGEIARLLDEAADGPLILEKDGIRYRLDREGSSDLPAYDAAATLAGIRAAGGSWSDLDAEALKADLYRAREEGTHPPDRYKYLSLAQTNGHALRCQQRAEGGR
jgi:hypothetical protein